MQDIVCAVIYSTAPANFWVPPPQKFHYVRIAERKNTMFSPHSSVGEGFPLPQNAQTYGYNLCHTILCHPEPAYFKGRTNDKPKDLCRPAATTNLDGKIKNIPSKKYQGCDSVADSSHSFLFSHTHLFCSE